MSKLISNIVFTKNRPLQLEGYLESLYKYFPVESIQTYIIYKPELFSDEYKLVFEKYPDCVVIKENDFYSDCLKVINQVNTKFILFGVDDVVYFNSVDFNVIHECFARFPDDILGFSLRHNYKIVSESDVIENVPILEQQVYKFNWKKGKSKLTSYPFDLCSTVYRTSVIKKIIKAVRNNNLLIQKLFTPNSGLIKGLGKVISDRPILKAFGYFFSPNTLESWNCRWCQNNADKIPDWLYFQKLCASAIQVNMVNTSTKNQSDNDFEYTVEVLNEKYKQGYRLEIGFVAENKPTSTHSERGHFKLIKVGNSGLNKMPTNKIDIIIPYHSKDSDIINMCITGCKKNILGIGDIYVVTGDKSFDYENVTVIDENDLFRDKLSLTYIKSCLEEKWPSLTSRSGWLFQQFIKMGCSYAIANLSDHYLVVDSDVIFLKKICFFNEGGPLLTKAKEYHEPYFNLYEKLLGESANRDCSFIAHHMLISKSIMSELLEMIENKSQKKWYDTIMDMIDFDNLVFSEYETYGHYLKNHHGDKFQARELTNIQQFKWKSLLKILLNATDYVTIHNYKKPQNNPKTSALKYNLFLKLVRSKLLGRENANLIKV